MMRYLTEKNTLKKSTFFHFFSAMKIDVKSRVGAQFAANGNSAAVVLNGFHRTTHLFEMDYIRASKASGAPVPTPSGEICPTREFPIQTALGQYKRTA
jgi:hypothetical protein